MTIEFSTADSHYNIVHLDRPFATALVCNRCGALVPRSGDQDGAARELHDGYHKELDAMLIRLNILWEPKPRT